ncbi:MAG: tyrosine-type recombinase/integrase [Christensenellales bacterium]|jgi:integrase/recombinase XerC
MAQNSDYRKQLRESMLFQTEALSKELPRPCRRFLLSIESTTSALTQLGYARDLKTFFTFLTREYAEFADKELTEITAKDIEKITSAHIEEYLHYLTLYYVQDGETNVRYTNDNCSKQRKLCAVRVFMNYLFKNELISSNVAALVDVPKPREKAIVRLEIDEVARLLDYVETGKATSARQRAYNDNTRLRDLTIITLFLGTGIRVSELVGLDIDDLDFEAYAFVVTRKGGNQQILYFPDEVADLLEEYMEHRKELKPLPGHENALFLSLQRKRIGVRTVEIMVKKYAKQASPLKTRISPHKLRATYATNLYNSTGDIYIVADLLGHSDVNTTRKHYAAMNEENRRRAAKRVVLRESAEEKKRRESEEQQ